MTDFATELDNYIPKPYKHIIRSDYIVITNPNQYKEAAESLTEDGIICCRTITGNECANTKCVGFCWNEVHRGYLTKKQMEQHQCLEKNCHRFEKIETAPYWAQQTAKKQTRKDGKQTKKQAINEADEFLAKIRELTINDFNFYPVACELKDNTYEVRIINYKSIDFVHYRSLFFPVSKGRGMHFTKIKTDNERKQMIIDKHNIVKIPAVEESVTANQVVSVEELNKIKLMDFVICKIKCIMKYINNLFSKGD